jgi:hypothetical protein
MDFFCLAAEVGQQCFLASEFELKRWLFLGLQSEVFQTRT